MVFNDFGSDNGPVGVPVDVYSSYGHATTKPNPLDTVSTVSQSCQRLATVFARTIGSLKALEATNPAPTPPLPTNPDWKQAPHPDPGTYEIVVKVGPSTRNFLVSCPTISGEPAAAALERVRPQLIADAKQVIAEHADLETTEMRSLKPPPGFTLATQEMLDVRQGSRGVEPHLIGDPLCLVPIDKQLAMAALDHSIKKLLTATSQIKPNPAVANLLIKGPGFDGSYTVSLTPGSAQDDAVAKVEKEVGNRLDELNRKAL